ncbi:MAG: four helix bundle protein [Candidatus Omnitrophica bacterium]|nr:four helix bundle protein [Candidatus Omnitrophota bacterium]
MARYSSFEELPVWQNAKTLAIVTYKISSNGRLSKDFSLKDQIRRCAVSISSNIAEGFERGTKQEFIQFLYIARGSCGELRSQIRIAEDIGYISHKDSIYIRSLAQDVSRQINGFVEYLKKSSFKGQKFK